MTKHNDHTTFLVHVGYMYVGHIDAIKSHNEVKNDIIQLFYIISNDSVLIYFIIFSILSRYKKYTSSSVIRVKRL